MRAYARLLASIGINAVVINGTHRPRPGCSPIICPDVSRLAAVFREYGIAIYLSVNFGPMS